MVPTPSRLQRRGPGAGGNLVRVLYIAGIGRSGSTLLDRTLGATDGLFAAGELMHFFGRGMRDNDFCACGSPVRGCSVWRRVFREVEAGGLPADPAELDAFRHRITEGALLPAPFLPRKPPGLRARLDAYRALLGRVYVAVQRVTGCRLLVDSSKNLGYARILLGVPEIRLHVVHLVRDSRGVAFSLEKRTRRPGARLRLEYLDRRRAPVGAVLWTAANLLAETLRRRAAGYVRLRYRDFVTSPIAALREILGMAGGEELLPSLLDRVRDDSVELGVQHLLSGNPSRSLTGRIRLREDLEWREAMAPGKRRLVTALTFPLLARYGYLGAGDLRRGVHATAAERTFRTGRAG